jgi:hypothetical protein
MKKLLAFSLFVTAGTVLGVLLLGLSLQARAGGGAVAVHNGDANGDGGIDISDAVYLLIYLFKGGQAPVACADSPDLLRRVEALEKAAADLPKALEDVASALTNFGATPCRERPDRFVDNGDGTVTDTCTGLMWQQLTADGNGDGDLLRSEDRMTFPQADAYVQSLNLAGHTDWRLPTAREFEALVLGQKSEHERNFWPRTFDPVFAVTTSTNAGESRYWTSTSYRKPDVRSVDPRSFWSFSFVVEPFLLECALLDPPLCQSAFNFVLAVRDP